MGKWVTVQRVILHVATFVLFFGGSAVMGELSAVKLLGLLLFLAAIASGVLRWRARRA